MNHPFIKMLKYEWKANFMMWGFYLIIGIGLLSLLYYFKEASHTPVLPAFVFPIFTLLTWIFTINSYQESTKNQSMQMYHLIPVSKNTKFFSKQFITLVAFPLAFALVAAICIQTIKFFTNDAPEYYGPRSINHTEQNIMIIWLLGHSVSTFFAILFKKNKVLYAILVYFCFQIALSIFFTIIFFGLVKNNDLQFSSGLAGQHLQTWGIVGALSLTAIFYGMSYHLFNRRQL